MRSVKHTLLFWCVCALTFQWFYWIVTEAVPLVEFMYLVFTRMPGESCHRWLRSLLLYLCYIFWALINSLVGWFDWLFDFSTLRLEACQGNQFSSCCHCRNLASRRHRKVALSQFQQSLGRPPLWFCCECRGHTWSCCLCRPLGSKLSETCPRCVCECVCVCVCVCMLIVADMHVPAVCVVHWY